MRIKLLQTVRELDDSKGSSIIRTTRIGGIDNKRRSGADLRCHTDLLAIYAQDSLLTTGIDPPGMITTNAGKIWRLGIDSTQTVHYTRHKCSVRTSYTRKRELLRQGIVGLKVHIQRREILCRRRKIQSIIQEIRPGASRPIHSQSLVIKCTKGHRIRLRSQHCHLCCEILIDWAQMVIEVDGGSAGRKCSGVF